MKSKEHVLHFFTVDEKFPKMSFFLKSKFMNLSLSVCRNVSEL